MNEKEMKWQEKILLHFLKIFVPVYELGLHIRKVQAHQQIRRLQVPVISVGNLTVGGTGKSLMISYLANLLRDKWAFHPGIVCRGYKGKITKAQIVDSSDVMRFGDEAIMLHQMFPLQVAVGREKEKAAQLLIEQGANAILLDDGFQYWSLYRNVDILLWDALQPIPTRLLPAGPLREPLECMSRAAFLCLTRTNLIPRAECEERLNFLQTLAPEKRIFCLELKVVHPHPEEWRRILAVCGIANPFSFQKTLETLSLSFQLLTFPDHYPYKLSDVQRMIQKVQQEKLDGILTTPKDMVKLSRFSLPVPVFPLEVALQPEGSPQKFEQAIYAHLFSSSAAH